MAWMTTIIAADGAPLTLCYPGPGIPSSDRTLQYVNPRTTKTERAKGILAWAGSDDAGCPEGSISVTLV